MTFGVESLQEYATKKIPGTHPTVELKDRMYVLKLDGVRDFQSQRYEDVAAHIDMIELHYRFL